jgi:DNA-binding XRE family transcriptional regulator
VATTVREWTGLEAKALRAALRMTMREFADYLGVGTRTVAKWEARGRGIQPLPQTQAILDTALAKASSDAQARFTAAVSGGSLASTMSAACDPVERGGDVDAAAHSSVPVTQSGVLLPSSVVAWHWR